MLIIRVDLGNEAILNGVDLNQPPEFREVFCGINAAEVVALGWSFAIKATNSADRCGGIEGFLTQAGHQRLTERPLIQSDEDSNGIRPVSMARLCSDQHRF